MVRIQDIAKAANVSPATVSRCLRKDPTLSISSETGKRIYDIALEMGYKNLKPLEVPNEFLVIHKDSHFLDHIDNGYYFSIRSGIEDEIARGHDICRFIPISRLDSENLSYSSVLVMGNYTPEDIQHVVSSVSSDNIVFIGKLNFLPEGFDTITYDVHGCVKLCMDALREAGITQLLFIDGKDHCMIPEHYLKVTHVRDYVAHHPEMQLKGILESEGFGSNAGYKAIKTFLEQGNALPQAIFTATDPLAIGVMKALNEQGLKVGVDTSLVSINGDNAGQWSSPPLTTVDFHSREMGIEAVKIARDRLANKSALPKCVFFKPRLIERESIKQK